MLLPCRARAAGWRGGRWHGAQYCAYVDMR